MPIQGGSWGCPRPLGDTHAVLPGQPLFCAFGSQSWNAPPAHCGLHWESPGVDCDRQHTCRAAQSAAAAQWSASAFGSVHVLPFSQVSVPLLPIPMPGTTQHVWPGNVHDSWLTDASTAPPPVAPPSIAMTPLSDAEASGLTMGE